MSRGEPKYMAPVTGDQERIRVLEREREELERFLDERKGKPWSSGATNARSRLETVKRDLESLKGRTARAHLGAANEADDSRVIEIAGQQYLAPSGETPARARLEATNEAPEPEPEREPWRSPPIRVENVAGGQRVTRFVEVLPGNASNEGSGRQEYMPVRSP